MARVYVRVQGGIDVAEDLVIDTFGARRGEYRIAERRHVAKKLRARFTGERIEMRHHRIGQQQTVAARDLRFPKHRPSGLHFLDDARELPASRGLDLLMN